MNRAMLRTLIWKNMKVIYWISYEKYIQWELYRDNFWNYRLNCKKWINWNVCMAHRWLYETLPYKFIVIDKKFRFIT